MSQFQAVKFFDTHVEAVINGVEKVLSHAAFKELYDRVMEVESTALAPMVMPNNVITFGKTTTTMELNTYWPEAIFTVKFKPRRGEDRTENLEVPFPNVLLYFHLTLNGDSFMVNKARYFCTPKRAGELFPIPEFIREPDAKRGIYPLALPNIYAECRACYGQNTMPGGFKTDLRALDWYYLFLHQSTFNTDLTIPGVTNGDYDPSVWMSKLSDMDRFPYDLLK